VGGEGGGGASITLGLRGGGGGGVLGCVKWILLVVNRKPRFKGSENTISQIAGVSGF